MFKDDNRDAWITLIDVVLVLIVNFKLIQDSDLVILSLRTRHYLLSISLIFSWNSWSHFVGCIMQIWNPATPFGNPLRINIHFI